ncbi:MAG: hypothetical protein L0241_13490, partial [Planctomycetia bacterium]|nr:hypothetical protein [Planctomycetia bacterium]
MPTLNRREALAAAAALAGTGGLVRANQPARKSDLVKSENERQGTTDWQLTYVKFDAKARFRQSLIEGYCTRTSVAAGEKIGFCVSTNPASSFSIDVYRLGYYGGTGARLVKSFGPFDG